MERPVQNPLVGIISLAISIVVYGSSYVPVRKFESRDGLFVGLMMNVGQLVPCLLTSLCYGSATAYPLAMLTGALYAIGNSFVIFIFSCIGMAITLLLANVMSCVCGWAIARFGLLNTIAEPPEHPVINIIGVLTLCLGGLVVAFVRSEPAKQLKAPFYTDEVADSLPEKKISDIPPSEVSNASNASSVSNHRRVLGILLAMLCGVWYGNMPTPINILVKAAVEGDRAYSVHKGAYMLSYAVGAIVTSSVIFVAYALRKSNEPFINIETAVPALFSGFLYGTATSLMFVAMEHLNQVIVMPIISMTPLMISASWAIFYFGEIRGRRNLSLLGCGFTVLLVGVVLVAVSRISFSVVE